MMQSFNHANGAHSGTINLNAGGTLLLGTLSPGSTTTTTFTNNINLSGGTIENVNPSTNLVINALIGTTHAITLGASTTSTFDITADRTGTINEPMGGSGSLLKTDAGTLILGGANTYTGSTTVVAGALTVSGAGSIAGSTGLSVGGGAQFNYLPTTPGTMTLGAGSTLTLTANSTLGLAFGDTIAVQGAATTSGVSGSPVYLNLSGTFVSGTTYTLLTAASGLSGCTYVVNGPSNYTYTITQTDTAVQITPTAVSALPAEYWLGGLTGSPATWSTNSATATNWASDATGTPTALTPGSTTTVNFSATGAVNQGAMTLGANTTVAGIVVNDTTPIALNSDGVSALTIGTGGITVNNTSGNPSVTLAAPIVLGASQTWSNASTNALSVTGPISGTGNLTKAGAGTLVLSGPNIPYTGVTTDQRRHRHRREHDCLRPGRERLRLPSAPAACSTGEVQLNGNSMTVIGLNTNATVGTPIVESGSGTAGTDGTLTVNNASANTYAGVLKDGSTRLLALTKTGAGNLTVLGADTYTGTTTINAGTLQIGNGGATGSLSPSSTIVDNSVLTFNRTGSVTQGTNFSANPITGTGVLFQSGAGTVTLNAANNYTGTTVFSGATVSTVINGNGSLVLASGATLVGNVFIGQPGSVGGGTLQLGANNQISPSSIINFSHAFAADHAYLMLNGFSTSIAGLSLNTADLGGEVINGGSAPSTLTLAGSGTYTFGPTNGFFGTISNGTGNSATGQPLAVVKSGSGTQTFTGANNYTGGTTVDAGILQAGSTTAFGSATGASLTFGPGSTGQIQLFGNSMTVIGLNSNSTAIGTPTLESGSTTAGTDILTVNNAVANTFAGVLMNGSTRLLALTKSGAGSLTLGGASTYTGGTTVTAGSLLANNATGSATGTGPIIVNSTGTLGGNGTVSSTISVASGATLAPGSAGVGTLNSNDVTLSSGSNFNVTISAAGSTEQNVTGAVNLGGATLNISLGSFTPAPTAVYTILNNDGADAVVGTFNGFGNGATVTVGTVSFKIFYNGDGDGVAVAEAVEGAVYGIGTVVVEDQPDGRGNRVKAPR